MVASVWSPMSATPTVSQLARYRQMALALALSTPALGRALPADLTTLPLEQLLTMEVFSASKFTQNTSDAPAVVTVISAAEISLYGWRTLADVARSVRGLYVRYDRNYSYLGERGFLRPGDYNTRFLLLVDGNRINDAVYDQAPIGSEFPLDLDLVERIEFVPGPGSSIHGANALFGVINVVTKSGAALDGSHASVEVASGHARRLGARTGWQDGGANFLLAASAREADGHDLYYPEYDTAEQHHGVAKGLDWERGERLLARAQAGAASMTLIHARRVKGLPTAAFSQPFNDARSHSTERQTYFNTSWHSATGASEQLDARLYWGQYDSFGDYVNDDAPRSLNRDGSAARWWGAELSLVSTRIAQHTLLTGVDLQSDYRLHQYSYDVDPFASSLDISHRGRRAGVYLQDEVLLNSATRLNLGLRYDRSNGQAGGWSPRLALIRTLRPATTVKIIHGLAFRSPNAFERFYAYPGPGGQLANPDLDKERIRSTELALVQQFDTRARLTATVFRNVVSSLITQGRPVGAVETRFDNAAQIGARGAELEYEQRWSGGAALRTSYSYSHIGPSEQALRAPAHLAKLNLATPLAARSWRAAIEAQYVGRRSTSSGLLPAFWVANAHLSTLRLWDRIDAAIGIYNLFDRRYADPASVEHLQSAIAQDGRNLRVRIGYAF